jgi:enoyl-CoA hydratase
MEKLVTCEYRLHTALVTIQRPKALNALNTEVLEHLRLTFDEIEVNSAVKAVIVTGAGEKAFVAGADVAQMVDMTPEQARQFSAFGQGIMNRIANMRAVVVAAVNGFALGGGCELALACDIRIAAENAQFGIPEVSLGIIPGFGGTQRLSRLIGTGLALELLATGGRVSAQRAYEMGLVNRVVPADALMPECLKLAEQIAANSAAAFALGKQSVYAGSEMDLARGLELESSLFAMTFTHPDQREGMRAFLEKRKPKA